MTSNAGEAVGGEQPLFSVGGHGKQCRHDGHQCGLLGRDLTLDKLLASRAYSQKTLYPVTVILGHL